MISSHEFVMQIEEFEIIFFTFHIALKLWCEKIELSRMSYVMHREIMSLLKTSTIEKQNENRFASELIETLKENVIQNLFLKLNILKKRIRRHMSLFKIYRKALSMIIHKQSFIVAKLKKNHQRQRIERMTWQYWFDSMNLITSILFFTKLHVKMHFEMTHLINKLIKLWHSNAWNFFIKAMSKNICRTRKEKMIISDDILRIKSDDDIDTIFNYDKIIFIKRNYTENVLIAREMIVTIQFILFNDDLMFDDFDVNRLNDHELFLLNDQISNVFIFNIDQHIFVHMNRKYDDDEKQLYNDERFYIKRVLNFLRWRVKFLRQLHSIKNELKIEYFDRDWFAKVFNKFFLSLSYFLFVNDFEIHRNMYRSLKTFYLIFVNFSYKKRRILINVFTVILKSHDAHFKNVIENFDKVIRTLNRDQNLNINEEQTTICVFIMTFLKNMSQQTNNAEFFRHNAVMKCQICLCSKSDRDDLNYDVIVNDRYHWNIIRQRDQAQNLSTRKQKVFVQKTNIKIESSFMIRLVFSLNLVLSRSYDFSHFEWRNINRIMHDFFLSFVLNKKESFFYLKSFQTFRYSSDWSHIQNFIAHMWSWFFSKANRANLLMFFILRSHVIIKWYWFFFCKRLTRCSMFSRKMQSRFVS